MLAEAVDSEEAGFKGMGRPITELVKPKQVRYQADALLDAELIRGG